MTDFSEAQIEVAEQLVQIKLKLNGIVDELTEISLRGDRRGLCDGECMRRTIVYPISHLTNNFEKTSIQNVIVEVLQANPPE